MAVKLTGLRVDPLLDGSGVDLSSYQNTDAVGLNEKQHVWVSNEGVCMCDPVL